MSIEMTKRQQIFSEMMKEAEKSLRGLLQDFAGQVECEYLPYVESDVDRNVAFRTRDAVQAIIAGNTELMERYGVLSLGYAGEMMRKAIYEQMTDKMRDAYIADLEDRIEQLKMINRY